MDTTVNGGSYLILFICVRRRTALEVWKSFWASTLLALLTSLKSFFPTTYYLICCIALRGTLHCSVVLFIARLLRYGTDERDGELHGFVCVSWVRGFMGRTDRTTPFPFLPVRAGAGNHMSISVYL